MNQDNISEYKVTLWVRDWGEETAFKGLNVTLYDLDKKFVASKFSNSTGHVDMKLKEGSYSVSVQSGNRTVGYQEINITKTETITIKTWTYNINVTCIDRENKPLSDYAVFLYDQLVFYSPTNFTELTNQTGLLVNWTKTGQNGAAYFYDFWNGTYMIRVVGSEVIGESAINLQESKSITIIGNNTYLKLKAVTWSGESLSNATVYVYDNAGRLIFRDRTDQNGYILREDIYVGSYRVSVDWMETQVWSGILNTSQIREATIQTSVYRLTLRFVDPFGNSLPKAYVTIRRVMVTARARTYVGSPVELEADEAGRVSCLLPSGTYDVSCSYGIFSVSTAINLTGDYARTINTNIETNLWLLTLFVALPLVGLNLALERKRLRKTLETKKYKNMLLKLETMYNNGQVEYRTYRKLREEYETKLIKLGGREMK